ncbi:MAG: hypothetical protein BWX70_03458 [Verrucomicrobia bacterium ADurb.Bin070]|nr:MAG: hypothetical protein BWX70_03458 [Verrucomicrobia bacterium ADurb.Bin070]
MRQTTATPFPEALTNASITDSSLASRSRHSPALPARLGFSAASKSTHSSPECRTRCSALCPPTNSPETVTHGSPRLSSDRRALSGSALIRSTRSAHMPSLNNRRRSASVTVWGDVSANVRNIENRYSPVRSSPGNPAPSTGLRPLMPAPPFPRRWLRHRSPPCRCQVFAPHPHIRRTVGRRMRRKGRARTRDTSRVSGTLHPTGS